MSKAIPVGAVPIDILAQPGYSAGEKVNIQASPGSVLRVSSDNDQPDNLEDYHYQRPGEWLQFEGQTLFVYTENGMDGRVIVSKSAV